MNVIETLKFYSYTLIVYHYIICILYCENKKYFESTKYFKTFGLYINFNELQTNFTCHGLLKENWSWTKLWWLAHRHTSRKENKVVNLMKEVHRCTPQTPKDTIQHVIHLFSVNKIKAATLQFTLKIRQMQWAYSSSDVSYRIKYSLLVFLPCSQTPQAINVVCIYM